MRSLGFPEILVIAAIAVLLFGGSWFKNFGTGLGQTFKELHKARKELDKE